MNVDRRRLLYRASESVSTETEPESVFYDNPSFEPDEIYEKPRDAGKHLNHVSWDIDEYDHRKSRPRVHKESPEGYRRSRSSPEGYRRSRSSRFSSGYESRASNTNDINDEFYDESRDVINEIPRAPRHPYRYDEHYSQDYDATSGSSKFENRFPVRPILFDLGTRKKDVFSREPSWKKQFRKGGAYYITIDSDDDSSGYPSSGTYRQDGGSVTPGNQASERRRSFSLSPQSSDERARAPYQMPSPRSRSPQGNRLEVEAAVHWPAGSRASSTRDDEISNRSSVSSTMPLTLVGRGRSPVSSTSTAGTNSWRDNASTLSISEAFALQAKGYLMSRKLNDNIRANESSSGSDRNLGEPLLAMPPGTGSDVGQPLHRTESESSSDEAISVIQPLRTRWDAQNDETDMPLRSVPPARRKLSSTESVGSLASIFKPHRKLSQSVSGGSSSSLKRDSLIPMRERKNSSIFEDLNLTFREVSEWELDSDSEDDDVSLPLENGTVANGSAIMMRDAAERQSRRTRRHGTESPLPITSEDTEDMIVMIMSNRSPCVARFISFCGMLQLLCGFIIMMSGASGYLSDIRILNTGASFDFPIGFYIGVFFVFSGGFGIKSSHTKRKCVNVMAAISSAFSFMAAVFTLVLISYPGSINFSCTAEKRGLFIFHLVTFTIESIFAGVQCVMCAKSLLESSRHAKHLKRRENAKNEAAAK